MTDTVDQGPLHKPLRGLRVLEVSQIMAGPVCGLMLSDLGADVIKIEKFPGGDDARHYQKPGDTGVPPSFQIINRGKKSLAIDLRVPKGKAAFERLVMQADVVTENFRPGTMEKLGLGYAQLKALNPALIYCAISGYGRSGPLAAKGGFDLILQAFSGLISVTGEPGRAPVKPGVSLADTNAGILAAFGVLAAYIERLRTGRGQRVDTSLLQASMQQLYWLAAAYFSSGQVGKPLGTSHPLIAPYQVYQCADGGIAIGGANTPNWKRIAAIVGHPEWESDPRFATPASRLAHRELLETRINAVLSQKPLAFWLERFDEAGVPVGPLNRVDQALEHEQAKATGMVFEVDDAQGGKTQALGLPITLNDRVENRSEAAPLLGQHTSQVLGSFGFGPDEIRALLTAGIIFQPQPDHVTV